MSKIFSQLITQEAEKQRKEVQKIKRDDTETHSDATPSQRDAAPSRTPSHEKFTLDKSLMHQVISSLADAKTLPSAISIRMTEDEKQFIDDFILDTLRKEKLQGHEVSMAKLMRYALIYLLFKHEREFVQVLKETLLKDESRRLFQ